MAPNLLSLPPEVRHRILKYATAHGQLCVCNSVIPYTDKHHLDTLQNPNANLWLICSQLTEDLSAIRVPKPTLRFCRLWCARESLIESGAGWKRHIECFKRHFNAVDLQRDFRSEYEFIRFLDGAAQSFFGIETTYAITGDFKGPAGVDVAFYPI